MRMHNLSRILMNKYGLIISHLSIKENYDAARKKVTSIESSVLCRCPWMQNARRRVSIRGRKYATFISNQALIIMCKSVSLNAKRLRKPYAGYP